MGFALELNEWHSETNLQTKEYDSIDKDLFIPKPISTKELVVERLNKILTYEE
jgi:hypothetical protein